MSKKIMINTLSKAHIVPCTDIVYCMSDSPCVQICLRCGSTLVTYKALKLLMHTINVPFIVQISQSVLVNVRDIVSVDHNGVNVVELTTGERFRYTIKKKDLLALIDNGLNTAHNSGGE